MGVYHSSTIGHALPTSANSKEKARTLIGPLARSRTMKQTHRLDHGPFLVAPGKKIRLKDYDPAYTAGFKDKAEAKAALLEDFSGLASAQ